MANDFSLLADTQYRLYTRRYASEVRPGQCYEIFAPFVGCGAVMIFSVACLLLVCELFIYKNRRPWRSYVP